MQIFTWTRQRIMGLQNELDVKLIVRIKIKIDPILFIMLPLNPSRKGYQHSGWSLI